MSRPDGIRLQVYLARSGIGSRRNNERLIESGGVSVNGIPVTRQGVLVTDRDTVRVGKKTVRPVNHRVYVALNKPRNFLCAAKDGFGRRLASELIDPRIRARVFHVGRLDYRSSGLIFYTNDGAFAQAVMHPSMGVEREYLVTALTSIGRASLERFRNGMRIGSTVYRAKRYSQNSPHKALITLLEGKHREIREVFAHEGIVISTIHRVRVGVVSVRDIPVGGIRTLKKSEVAWFFDRAKNRPHTLWP